MPKIYNSTKYAPFSKVMTFLATEAICTLTVAESLIKHNFIDNFELPLCSNHATDIPSSQGDSESSRDCDITPDVSSQNGACPSSESNFLHIVFTFLHSTPCLGIHPPRFHHSHQRILIIFPLPHFRLLLFQLHALCAIPQLI